MSDPPPPRLLTPTTDPTSPAPSRRASPAAKAGQLPNPRQPVTRIDLKGREVIGIDPGERETGIIRREGPLLRGFLVVESPAKPATGKAVPLDPLYLAAIIAALDASLSAARAATARAPVIAVEGLKAPNGHVRMINARPLITTGVVVGAVLTYLTLAVPDLDEIVLVPPGGYGSLPLAAYPRQLVGPREGLAGMLKTGSGRLRHARSAWDIAGAVAHPALGSETFRYRPQVIGSEASET